MRKLAAGLVLLVLLVVVGGASSAGCSSPSAPVCNNACVIYNSLRCGATCDCSACGVAPVECGPYFDCIEAHGDNCIDVGKSCIPSAVCQQFVNAHCI